MQFVDEVTKAERVVPSVEGEGEGEETGTETEEEEDTETF